MRKYDLISGLFFSLCGLLITVGSLLMPIGTLGEPGPGLAPLCIGILLTIISIVFFIQSLRIKISEKKTFGLTKKQRYKVFTTGLSLIIFAFALRPLGFILVTLLLTLFLFKVIGELNWKVSVVGPILMTAFFYLLFNVWLEVQLPMMPIGM